MSVTLPAPVTPLATASLRRLGGVMGLLSAVVLLVNAAKRSGLLPQIPPVQLVAPIAQLGALALVTVLFLVATRPTSRVALAAHLVNAVALTLLVGVEFVLNLVFPYLTAGARAELLAGPLGVALPVVSVLFLIGTLAFNAVLIRHRRAPVWACVVYAFGGSLVALRSVLPEWGLVSGLVLLAGGVVGLSIWLLAFVKGQPVGRR